MSDNGIYRQQRRSPSCSLMALRIATELGMNLIDVSKAWRCSHLVQDIRNLGLLILWILRVVVRNRVHVRVFIRFDKIRQTGHANLPRKLLREQGFVGQTLRAWLVLGRHKSCTSFRGQRMDCQAYPRSSPGVVSEKYPRKSSNTQWHRSIPLRDEAAVSDAERTQEYGRVRSRLRRKRDRARPPIRGFDVRKTTTAG